MAATTTLLGLVTPTQGTLTGTWGDTVNYGISDYLDIAIAGTLSFAGDGAITLANTTGSSSGNSIGATTAQYMVIRVTGTQTITKIITGPSYSKLYMVDHAGATSAVTFKAAGQTGVSVAVGEKCFVYYNGTDYVKVASSVADGVTTIDFGSTGLTPNTATSGAVTVAGTLAVANGGTGLTAGTSGGVLAFTATGTLASSTALAASALVIGGGAGAAPSTTTTGTGVVTALGVNTGSAGAFVVNGGALGTPSSGSLANCTAYPGTSALTTVGALNSGSITSGFGSIDVGADEISGGAIKATTNVSADYPSSSAMAFTSGNGKLFAWGSTVGTAAEINIRGMSSDGSVFHQATFTQTGLNSTAIGQTSPAAGAFTTLSATGTLSGGTSGTAYSFSGSAPATSLTLDSSGNLGIGTSSPATKLDARLSGTSSGAVIQVGNTGTGGFGGLAITDGGAYPVEMWASALVFKTGNSTYASATEKMRLDSAGNLGLGVTPSAWNTSYKALEISALGNSLIGFGASDVAMSSGAYYDSAGWKYSTTNSLGASFYEQYNGQHLWYTKTAVSHTAGDAISFTQAMTLDASGNLGIGTTSPSTKLVVADAGVVRITALNTVGTVITQMLSSTDTGFIGTQSNHPLVFFTNTIENARIDTSGNLLWGTTNTTFSSGGVRLNANNSLEVVRDSAFSSAAQIYTNRPTNDGSSISFNRSGTEVGTIAVTTLLTTYNTTSDYRLKTVIGAVADSGSRIDALQPVEYTWNNNGSSTRGFLAHQFQEVYASSVTGTKDAVDAEGKPVYQAMQASTSEVIADLVAELQSLRARVAQLESKP